MIEAGVRALQSFIEKEGRVSFDDQEAVVAVYSAMLEASEQSRGQS